MEDGGQSNKKKWSLFLVPHNWRIMSQRTKTYTSHICKFANLLKTFLSVASSKDTMNSLGAYYFLCSLWLIWLDWEPESAASLWTFIRWHFEAHLKLIPPWTLVAMPLSGGWQMRQDMGLRVDTSAHRAWPTPLIHYHLVKQTSNSQISLPTGTMDHSMGCIPINWTKGWD